MRVCKFEILLAQVEFTLEKETLASVRGKKPEQEKNSQIKILMYEI